LEAELVFGDVVDEIDLIVEGESEKSWGLVRKELEIFFQHQTWSSTSIAANYHNPPTAEEEGGEVK
jgi:hypothetical protein